MSRWPPPPRLSASFYKAHGLGNDYLVFEEGDDWVAGVFPLRMFNPDGSEFERSGNGLRVLASWLARAGLGTSPYVVDVAGELVTLTVHDSGGLAYDVSCEMGRARVGPEAVELDPSALEENGRLAGPGGEPLHVVPVSVGNPHMVVMTDDVSEERLNVLGPWLVAHAGLAHGANVQLAGPAGPRTCDALIWERGVGPTSASGTSSCAVAVAMVHEGRLESGEIAVRMPGGTLEVTVSDDLDVVLRGPVEECCTGEIAAGLLRELAG